jgi:hypothetical protein
MIHIIQKFPINKFNNFYFVILSKAKNLTQILRFAQNDKTQENKQLITKIIAIYKVTF